MNGTNTVRAVRDLIQRDVTLALRRRSDVMTGVAFFGIVTSLFPLGIGPDAVLLKTIAPGVVWVTAVLTALLSLPRLFAADHADGTLEQLVLSPQPLALLVTGKAVAHWLVAGLPVVLLAPLLAVQYGLGGGALALLTVSLLVGTPVLSLVGSVGAALTLGLRGSSFLLALLVLPLVMPVLVFGAGTVAAGEAGVGAAAHLALLAACLILAVTFAPCATAAALRLAME